ARKRRTAAQAEDVELAALRLLRDGVAREEADTETLAHGSLHGFRRAELPHARRLDADSAQLAFDVRARARVGPAAEEPPPRQRCRVERPVLRFDEVRLRDA